MTLPLCLVPLVAISTFSYFVARERITEDRVVLFLQQIAAEVADVIRLSLLERKEETVSMTLYSEFRDYLLGRIQDPPVLLLDKLTLVNEVYDVIVLFDADGRLILTNSIDRSSTRHGGLSESSGTGRTAGAELIAVHARRAVAATSAEQPLRLHRLAYVSVGA
ncbi:MAG TPA: hypothetical protein PLM33_03210 [Acidobacteriota bacterium]|nr:hypothetical protein [Acidobacteriota bacterium]